jgi:hypothetical protein
MAREATASKANTYLPDAAQLRNGGVGRNEIDVVMG